MTRRFWIGVASREHVLRGVAGGFCQLGHGKQAPVQRLRPGDLIAYYAPRTKLEGGDAVQAFVAVGMVEDGGPWAVDMGGRFVPWRRAVRYVPVSEASVRPLVGRLAFIPDPAAWGYPFLRVTFAVNEADFRLIAEVMAADQALLGLA